MLSPEHRRIPQASEIPGRGPIEQPSFGAPIPSIPAIDPAAFESAFAPMPTNLRVSQLMHRAAQIGPLGRTVTTSRPVSVQHPNQLHPEPGSIVEQPSRRQLAQRARRQRERDQSNAAAAAAAAQQERVHAQQLRLAHQNEPDQNEPPELGDHEEDEAAAAPVQRRPQRPCHPDFDAARRSHPQAANVQVHYMGPLEVRCPDCQALHWDCEKLSKSTLSTPKFGTCCQSGKIRLSTPREPPPEFEKRVNSMYMGAGR